MIMRARGSTMIAALVATMALLVAAGCDKGKAGGGGAGGAGAAAGSPAGRALAALPADVDAVIGLSGSSLRSSGLYKKYQPMLMEAAGDEIAKVKDKCGFDPTQKVDQVVIALKGEQGEAVTVVAQGLTKAELGGCLEKFAAEKGGKVITDGNVMVVEKADSDKPMTLLWLDDKTVMMAKRGEGDGGKEVLQALAAGKDTLTSSKAFMDVINNVNTGASVWFVSNGKSPMAAKVPTKFLAAYGTVQVKDGLDIDMAMRFETEAEAKQLADMAQGQVGQLKSSPFGGMIGEIKIEAKGKDVAFKTSMTAAQIDQIAQFAKNFM
jgi:hypothetical protein